MNLVLFLTLFDGVALNFYAGYYSVCFKLFHKLAFIKVFTDLLDLQIVFVQVLLVCAFAHFKFKFLAALALLFETTALEYMFSF